MSENWAPLITGLIGAGCLAVGMLTRKIITSIRGRNVREISRREHPKKAEAREASHAVEPGGSIPSVIDSADWPPDNDAR